MPNLLITCKRVSVKLRICSLWYLLIYLVQIITCHVAKIWVVIEKLCVRIFFWLLRLLSLPRASWRARSLLRSPWSWLHDVALSPSLSLSLSLRIEEYEIHQSRDNVMKGRITKDRKLKRASTWVELCFSVSASLKHARWQILSYYKKFHTGNGEILPSVGCNQLPFWVTLLVVTQYYSHILNFLFERLPWQFLCRREWSRQVHVLFTREGVKRRRRFGFERRINRMALPPSSPPLIMTRGKKAWQTRAG